MDSIFHDLMVGNLVMTEFGERPIVKINCLTTPFSIVVGAGPAGHEYDVLIGHEVHPVPITIEILMRYFKENILHHDIVRVRSFSTENDAIGIVWDLEKGCISVLTIDAIPGKWAGGQFSNISCLHDLQNKIRVITGESLALLPKITDNNFMKNIVNVQKNKPRVILTTLGTGMMCHVTHLLAHHVHTVPVVAFDEHHYAQSKSPRFVLPPLPMEKFEIKKLSPKDFGQNKKRKKYKGRN